MLQITCFADKFINDDPIFLCKCDCGNDNAEIPLFKLRRNKIDSCGCLIKENHLKTLAPALVENTNLNCIRSSKPQKNSISKVKGVSWNQRSSKWLATLGFQGTKVLNKHYDNLEDAIEARKAAEEKYYNPILDKYKWKNRL